MFAGNPNLFTNSFFTSFKTDEYNKKYEIIDFLKTEESNNKLRYKEFIKNCNSFFISTDDDIDELFGKLSNILDGSEFELIVIPVYQSVRKKVGRKDSE
jgi:hypothetical protein